MVSCDLEASGEMAGGEGEGSRGGAARASSALLLFVLKKWRLVVKKNSLQSFSNLIG